MEVLVMGAFLNTFAPKLWDLIKGGHELRDEVRQDIQLIQAELPVMSARIREPNLMCISTSGEAVDVINKARRWARDTEECICQFMYQTRSSPHRRTNKKFAIEIRRLKEDFKEISGEVSRLKPVTSSLPEPDDPHFGEEDLVGMDMARMEIQELLERTPPIASTGSESKGKLKVISIVGFGGSGKTRLAKQVYEDVDQQFDQRAWASVAKKKVNEVLEALLEEMLKMVSPNHSIGVHHGNNGASISQRLKSFLDKQRYLIVIDDVRRIGDWETLENAFPDSDVDSRIIVTTTSQPVAARCSFPNGHVYKMGILCGKDSDNLFFGALTGQHSVAVKKELSTVVKICDGLPIALIGSAKSLKGTTLNQDECQEAIYKLSSPKEGINDTLRRLHWVLMNKYSGVTSYGARACLLYFHMFPYNIQTKRKFLTRRWLAEELVERYDPNCSDLDAASKHLKTLSDGNIIRSTQLSNNASVKSCRLPGTMHEFITRQSMSQNFVTLLCHGNNKPVEPSDVRRLSLRDGAAESKMCIEGVRVSLLRTLAVSGKACEAVMDFSQYDLLRVLDLKECDYKLNEKKLISICNKLVMLKYLGLPGSIGAVPREIIYLIHLETLDLGDIETVKVYGEVINLPRLKHLLGKFRLSTSDNPARHVPKDSTMETLSGFVTNQSAAFANLMIHMKQLRKVKMWCDFNADKGEVKHLSNAIQGFILMGSTDPVDVGRSLSIDVSDCKVQFLEYLQAPGRLTKLKLYGELDKVPEFVIGLAGITELCLSSTTLSAKFLDSTLLAPDTDLLPLLRYLKLVEDDLGPLKILPKHFPSLERICLVGKESLQDIQFETGALQYLLSLHIMCKALDGLAGIQIASLHSLREIALDSQSEVTPETKIAWKDAAKGHPNRPSVLFIEAAPRS